MASPSQYDLGEPLSDAPQTSEVHGAPKTQEFVLAYAANLPVPLHANKVVVGELQNVLASMRLNSRWSDLSRTVCFILC
jgi:hypothetical protein